MIGAKQKIPDLCVFDEETQRIVHAVECLGAYRTPRVQKFLNWANDNGISYDLY